MLFGDCLNSHYFVIVGFADNKGKAMQRESLEKERGAERRSAWEKERGGQQNVRGYAKGLTVLVEIEGDNRITMMEMLRKVKEECGAVIACRYKTPKEYELTMEEEKGKEKLLDGLKIKESRIMAKEISSNEMVVSFLGLPAYIEDEKILKKLTDWGVAAISKIKRRMWPGTDIADGTRFLKVRFTDTVKSLPYSTKFETAGGGEYFRVIHDRQVKVCRLCIQPGHVVRECPNFVCFRCKKQGHYARECSEDICKTCGMRNARCVCEASEDAEGDLFTTEHEEWGSLMSAEEKEVDDERVEESSKEQGVSERERCREVAVEELRQRRRKGEEMGEKGVSTSGASPERRGKVTRGEDEEDARSGKRNQDKSSVKSKKTQEIKEVGGSHEMEVQGLSETEMGELMDIREDTSTQRKRKKNKEEEKLCGKK